MLHYINYRMRVTISDNRQLVGTLLAFDKFMNLVLGETEEFRVVKSRKASGSAVEEEQRRVLGLVILRGSSVISLQVEAPPRGEAKAAAAAGPGVARAAGRGALPPAGAAMGMAGPAAGLAGPVAGVGGPGMSAMHPGMPPGMPRGMPGSVPGMHGMPPGMPGMPPRGYPQGMPPPGRG
ncbi:SNRPB [Symbiodinium sp. KB8]|nr:SNRPB [Symbiodinium sp. KB8]